MKSVTPLAIVLFLGLGLSASACGGSNATTTPTTPTVPTTTDTFNGTLLQGGSNVHTFTITQAGEVDATLTAVGPLNTMQLGFYLGLYDGTNCNVGVQTSNGSASQGQTLAGNTSQTGTGCVRVYDVGNIPASFTVTYTVAVTHP